MGKRIEYKEGEKIGTSFYVKDVVSSGNTRKSLFKCGFCGKEFTASLQALKGGKTKSCGCIASTNSIGKRTTTHGATRGGYTPEYSSWLSMRTRCYNENNHKYKDYGALGIIVSDRWRDSFENFLADMGPRPEGTSLDRFPNMKGNYEPGNCRWATPKQQAQNRKTSREVLYKGQLKPLWQWCEELNLCPKNTYLRIHRRKWTVAQAFETPLVKNQFDSPKRTNFISHSFGVVAV